MSSQNWEWAVRVGISPNYLHQTWSPEIGISYIRQPILWRWEEVMTVKRKIDWQWQAYRFASGRVHGPQPLFWRELLHKKIGLFGYHNDISADPIALARHPWSLKKHEFEAAFSAVEDGNVPTVPDDRAHVSAVLTAIGGMAALAGTGAALTGVGAPAAPAFGVVAFGAGVGAAAVGLPTSVADYFHAEAFKAHMPQLRGVYAREAGYWKRGGPMRTSSRTVDLRWALGGLLGSAAGILATQFHHTLTGVLSGLLGVGAGVILGQAARSRRVRVVLYSMSLVWLLLAVLALWLPWR